MERKLLMVFALTFLVIMLFQPLMKKYGPQPPAQPASPQNGAESSATFFPEPHTTSSANLAGAWHCWHDGGAGDGASPVSTGYQRNGDGD